MSLTINRSCCCCCCTWQQVVLALGLGLSFGSSRSPCSCSQLQSQSQSLLEPLFQLRPVSYSRPQCALIKRNICGKLRFQMRPPSPPPPLSPLAIKCDLFLLIFLFVPATFERAWAFVGFQLLPTSRLLLLPIAHCPRSGCPCSLPFSMRCYSHTLHSVTSVRTLLLFPLLLFLRLFQSQCHSMMQCSSFGFGSSYVYDPADDGWNKALHSGASCS